MGNLSRRKGAAFEREVAALIRQHLGVDVSRNLAQYQQSGQSDLNGLPGWSIECKCRAGITEGELANCWAETCAQAESGGHRPILIFRANRGPVKCVLRLCDVSGRFSGNHAPVLVGFETWCVIVTADATQKVA